LLIGIFFMEFSRASVEMKDLLGHQTQEVFASALVALAR